MARSRLGTSPMTDRRRFLRGAGAAALTLAPLGIAHARVAERRSLSFVHTHTCERLEIAYFDHGSYRAAALERINYLLRDFRSGDVHPIAPSLLDILFDLQHRTQHDGAFEVISGYRSPTTNAELRRNSHGVAEHSLHIEGRAIDVRLARFPTRALHELALGMGRGGVGFYPSSDFVHLDNGRIRFWQG